MSKEKVILAYSGGLDISCYYLVKESEAAHEKL